METEKYKEYTIELLQCINDKKILLRIYRFVNTMWLRDDTATYPQIGGENNANPNA